MSRVGTLYSSIGRYAGFISAGATPVLRRCYAGATPVLRGEQISTKTGESTQSADINWRTASI